MGGFMKKGFGLMEVLVAAVVLGFMILGLNTLQKGNRDALLRVRARDAASFVAQHVLDSLGAVGLNSIEAKDQSDCKKKLVVCDTAYKYNFEGKPQLDKSAKGITAEIEYKVEVELLANNSEKTQIIDKTNLKTTPDTTTYAKNLEATVSWKFKNSTQSIKIAKVVR